MLSEFCGMVSTDINAMLVAMSSSAPATPSSPGAVVRSSSTGSNKMTVVARPTPPVKPMPAPPRLAVPVTDYPPSVSLPATNLALVTPGSSSSPVPVKSPPSSPFLTIPAMPTRPVPMDMPASGTYFFPVQLPYKAAPPELLRVTMKAPPATPLVRATPREPAPQPVTFVLPGIQARQEPRRASSVSATARQPLAYGTSSGTAPTRHGPPVFFEDSPTPGWKFVLQDLPPNTTREEVRSMHSTCIARE